MRLPDPSLTLTDEDKKDKAKVKAARKNAPGWRLPSTKAEKKAEQQERIDQWQEEGQATW